MNKKLLLFIIALFIGVNTASADIPGGLNDACQVYLKMEEAASPMQDELGNVTYSCANCPEFHYPGIIGFGMNYTAANSDKMTAAANSVFNTGTSDFTACFWVEKKAASDNIYPWAQWDNTPYYGLQLNDNQRPTAWVAYTAAGTRIVIYGSNNDIPDLGWHFYCQVRSGVTGTAYIDAVDYSTTVLDDGNPNIGEDINYFGSDGANFFNAAIDEFSFFNKALNITEVQYLYNGGSPGSEQQYPFGPAPAVPNNTILTYSAINGTTYTNCSFAGTTTIYFNSTNETAMNLSFFENSTKIYMFQANNMTTYTINLTNLTTGVNNYHWQAGANRTDNVTLIIFPCSEITIEKFDYYVAIVLLTMTVVIFLYMVSDKFENSQVTELLLGVPMIKYFILLCAGWFLFGAFDIVIGIVEIENITRLTGVTTALYSGLMYFMLTASFIWFIALLYLLFMHFQSWLSK